MSYKVLGDSYISRDSEENEEHRRFSSLSISKIAILVFIVIPWVLTAFLVGLLYQRTGRENQVQTSKDNEQASPPHVLYSPVDHLVEYRFEKFNEGFGWDTSIYQGAPSPEIDAAWDELYHGIIYSRIPKHQAALLANRTSPIPGDEGYYVVMLNVFHELHCLNMIRKKLYPDYYTDPELEAFFKIHHIDHCIDSIRASLMCSSDITPMVWQWYEPDQKFEPRNDVVHLCRNFDKIHDWAAETPIKEQMDYSIHIEDDLVYEEF